MTVKKYQQKLVSISYHSKGHYRVIYTRYGKRYSHETNNIAAIERIKFRDEVSDKTVVNRYTLKQAYKAIFNQ